jgi:putative ABC transport system permease protein
MFQVFWQHWKQRPARIFLTIVSLMLATATLVGILVASHNARSSFQQLGKAVQGLPSVDIVNADGGRFEQSAIADVPTIPKATAQVPMLIRGSLFRFKDNKSRGLVIGVPLDSTDSKIVDFVEQTLEIEQAIPKNDECVVSSLIASSLGVQEGDSIQCLFRRGFRKLVVKRIVDASAWNRLISEHGLLVDLDWLQKVTALHGQIDRYRVFLPADDPELKKSTTVEIAGYLGSPLKVQERTNNVGVADDLLKSTELGLSFASALAVAMAAYILLNTTRMNLAERRPHFAILKCVGATSEQIFRAILSEALLLSVVAVVLGCVLGCGLGAVMSRVLSAVIQAPANPYSIPWFLVALVACLLPCVTLVVAWYAYRQQDEVSPLESFREPAIAEQHGLPWRSILRGMSLWCLSMLGMACVQREWLHPQWGVIVGLFSLVAYLLWIPLGLVPLNMILRRLARTSWGFPVEIAGQQLARLPERTTLNAGFLVIALCGAVGLGQVLMSNTAEILRWYHRVLPGDVFLISTGQPSLVIDSEDPMREKIEQLPGLKWSNPIRFVRCQVDEQPVLGIVREFPENAPFPTEPKGMDNATARQTIANDTIFIAAILAKKLGKKTGESVTVSLNGRSFSLPIGGINANFANGGMSFMMHRATAQKHMEVTGFDWCALAIEPDHREEAKAQLESIKGQFGFELQMGSNMRRGVEQAISGVTAGVWSVVFISFLTGGFGIATTLAMNMIEQARDLSLLRIVGAGRWQLMMTVLMQAWLLGILGVTFGMIGGMTTVIVIWSCSEALLGYTPEFQWDLWLMVGSALGTLAIVTIAAWFPAWKASQVNPIEHLSYE